MAEYQRIKIDGKMYANGIDRETEYRAIFPDPPIGVTLLDVGCHFGFYPIRAVNEGAAWGAGIEKNKRWASVGQKAAAELGYNNVMIRWGNVFELPFDYFAGDFNTILCLNFLHHMRDIGRVAKLLLKLDNWATKRLVFVTLDPSDTEKLYGHESTPRGSRKLRISGKYFSELWPKYSVMNKPSTVSPPGRSIVNVYKE